MSVVIPVKDGERYLEELLDALAREGVDETLVIDSGSRDRSREIARAAGVELIEIAPQEFGHGRTRNLGAERTSGELICFLTQDATPCPGWLAAYREALALDERVGAAYGPHLPRPDTSPMIARELNEFFAGFAPDGRPVVQRPGDADVPLERQRLLPASPAGRRFASATSPTPRTRRSGSTCSRRAGPRSTTRARRCCTPTTTARSSSCAATSTSTAACARAPATSSRSRHGPPRATCSTRSRRTDAGWPSRG